ncbi:MAG: molybdopterin-dependent oxidoreductase [Planctomycetes bacterium]|nr:molybdopterin-dependent oxidoreductase [Planctomycetota bacterium]
MAETTAFTLNDKPVSDFQLDLSRRELLKTLGGGIVIFFCLGDRSILEAQQHSLPSDFNAFLRIGADGRVTGYTGKIEMGQGNRTALAQILADELDVSLESVDMVMGDTALCPWDDGTWGSTSIRSFGPPFRAAAAEARSVLRELAAERLRVPQDRLVAQDGVIFDGQQPDQRVTYGELAQGQTIARRAKQTPAVKSPSEFTVINKPVLRRDATEKVTGQALYAGDIRLPGMLYARILRPPAHGATLKDVDTSAAEKVEGVTVVREGDLVAVLHPDPEQANEALSRVWAEFYPSPSTLDDQTIFDHLVLNAGTGRIVAQGGSLGPGRMPPAVVVEQTYLDGYKAHAAMETHTALAQVEGNKMTVWVGTQTPFPAKDEIVAALGFAANNVRVITPFVGGGFGGKGSVNTQAVEAARLSRATGKPVQVCWNREEEFFFDAFRPAAVVKIKAGLTKDGKLMSWDYNVYAAGDRGAAHFYDIPNHRTTSFDGAAHPFATGPWRAPGNSTNCFARESHIDLLAAHAQMDPIEFRLKHLKDQRAIRVLEAAAEKFGWQPAAAPSGRGLGVAVGTDVGTWVAAIAEVEVDSRTGHVQVKRVVCAQDMGLVVNPQGAILQMEGCLTMGLGYTLSEDVHFKNGMILDRNFDMYELPRFTAVPKIETVVLDLKDQPTHGGGEPAIIIVGAVVANAIHDATGVRLLQLPMTPERVRKAIAAIV